MASGRRPDPRRERGLRPVLASAAGLAFPGLRRVRGRVEPFAQAWREANAAATGGPGLLWVALGDSMSQGIGAADIGGGWVGQLHDRYLERGLAVRVVNLSVTGARIGDVVDRQLPQLAALAEQPDLVTVLAGANDMVLPSRRGPAAGHMAALLAGVPHGRTVIATLPRRNAAAQAVNALVDQAAQQGTVWVADTRGRTARSLIGTRADDHFHPNERGYRSIADTFERAIAASGLLG